MKRNSLNKTALFEACEKEEDKIGGLYGARVECRWAWAGAGEGAEERVGVGVGAAAGAGTGVGAEVEEGAESGAGAGLGAAFLVATKMIPSTSNRKSPKIQKKQYIGSNGK